jgi:ABC-type branched-subunit amino acid transport system permease subunit
VTGLHQLDLACPAGVEPATYGLEGLKNLDKQCSTMGYLALIWVFVLTPVFWVLVESRVGFVASAGVCRENRHFVDSCFTKTPVTYSL